MSLPDDCNAEIYTKYLHIHAELIGVEDALKYKLHHLRFTKVIYQGSAGPRGFSVDAFYFTELHWLVLIQDVLHSIKGLKERIAFYEKNKVERLSNEVFDELQKQGFTKLLKAML